MAYLPQFINLQTQQMYVHVFYITKKTGFRQMEKIVVETINFPSILLDFVHNEGQFKSIICYLLFLILYVSSCYFLIK